MILPLEMLRMGERRSKNLSVGVTKNSDPIWAGWGMAPGLGGGAPNDLMKTPYESESLNPFSTVSIANSEAAETATQSRSPSLPAVPANFSSW